jgi:hypothetical protein
MQLKILQDFTERWMQSGIGMMQKGIAFGATKTLLGGKGTR